MRGGRSTSRGSPTPTGTAWERRARWCAPARRAPRLSGCGAPALAFPNDAHDDALDHDAALVHAQRRHGGGGGSGPNTPPPAATRKLHGGARAPHPRPHAPCVIGRGVARGTQGIVVLTVI